MIRDSSLTLSGLLSSDELDNNISHVCMSCSWFLVSLFSCHIVYFVYDLIINNKHRTQNMKINETSVTKFVSLCH